MIAALLAGCCGSELPRWERSIEPLQLPLDASGSLDLRPLVTDDRGELVFAAQASDDLIVEVRDGVLFVTPQPGFAGIVDVDLEAIDPCGGSALTTLTVFAGVSPPEGYDTATCRVMFHYETGNAPDGVAVAGAWNAWDPSADAMEEVSPGLWRGELYLPKGGQPYKFVEITEGAFEDAMRWTCDPAAPLIQCDAGAVDPFATSFDPTCVLDASPCNSLVVVGDCPGATATLDLIDLDRAERSLSVTVSGAMNHLEVSLDGASTLYDTPGPVTATFLDIAPGRHELAVSGDGAPPLTWSFWIDGPAWDEGLMYFAFVDRLVDGDAGNSGPEGATAAHGDYQGGDFAGVTAMLPYLADLGVTSLWLSNPLDNAEGAWSGDCGETYAGYHAYWPDDPAAVEEHFGDEADLLATVDAAHGFGMRVVVDWVGNHVHQDHPFAVDEPAWFTVEQGCKDTVDGGLGFDTIPETCWFAPYLPDIDYAQPEPLARMVGDAVDLALRWHLDGFRVDAVKHMSHAVAWNLDAEIERRIEHADAGGDEDFYTVGETFDGHDRIAAYIGPDQLDGQFDFPQYYAIRDALAHDGDLGGLVDAAATSRAVFGDARMGVFLGNHDVARFVSDAAGEDLGACGADGLRVATAPTDARAYDRLRLAFAWVLTQPGVPLLYYGDEIGLPGFGDPDNRQPWWWHAPAAPQDVEEVATEVAPGPAAVVRFVRDLTAVRRAHPALRTGTWVEWWREPALVGFARVQGDDAALVLINRSDEARALTNGLAFAGLPEGAWTDALGDATATSSGDSLSVTVPPWSAMVWVPDP